MCSFFAAVREQGHPWLFHNLQEAEVAIDKGDAAIIVSELSADHIVKEFCNLRAVPIQALGASYLNVCLSTFFLQNTIMS